MIFVLNFDEQDFDCLNLTLRSLQSNRPLCLYVWKKIKENNYSWLYFWKFEHSISVEGKSFLTLDLCMNRPFYGEFSKVNEKKRLFNWLKRCHLCSFIQSRRTRWITRLKLVNVGLYIKIHLIHEVSKVFSLLIRNVNIPIFGPKSQTSRLHILPSSYSKKMKKICSSSLNREHLAHSKVENKTHDPD